MYRASNFTWMAVRRCCAEAVRRDQEQAPGRAAAMALSTCVLVVPRCVVGAWLGGGCAVSVLGAGIDGARVDWQPRYT
jgi:prolipoprotein diacylglyceryltransferase